MILCEEHSIRRSACRELFDRIDDFCYRSKNLHNLANYLITQCSRISRKLKDGGILEEWESELICSINTAIGAYNDSRPGKKEMQSISEQNGFLSDAYFLSWYLKRDENYRAMPYATCARKSSTPLAYLPRRGRARPVIRTENHRRRNITGKNEGRNGVFLSVMTVIGSMQIQMQHIR